MGFEILTQPQVFLAPITAVGGIQNGLFNDPLPPLYTSFFTWTSTASVTATTFPLEGIETLTNRSGSYIVTVGGVVQSPTNYIVDPNTRRLTFDFTVNPNTEVIVTQIGTTVSLVSVSNLSATNSVLSNVQANRLLVTNLTALSAEFRVVDITQFELSGFTVLGNANIVGNSNVTGTVSSSNVTATNSTLTNLTATSILLSDTGTLLGATSATSINIGALSARTFDLIHSPANDGVDPIFNIGETATTGFSGFRLRYEEPTNRLIGSSRTGTTILTSVIVDVATGQVGVSGLPAPGQALTVSGNVSATGGLTVAGNLGIGTGLPNQPLTVIGNVSATGDLFSNNSLLSFGAANTTTASPGQIFYGTNSDIVLDANSRYELIFDLYFAKTTATTVTYAISGTTTFTNVVANYIQQPATGIASIGPLSGAGTVGQTTALITLPVTNLLTTGVNHYAQIKATVETNTAVRVNLTTWNGAAGTVTPLRGSYWVKRRIN